ncbi:tripartite tricarboxylate transporter TctB family protein [Desulforhopalus singaporensis]|uniref:Putative tricarboxylic transport membrane protein n=1 Tax=Desulforhopalus singaporensis TaxID=91360 RepID=A0A1H0KR53_9BACT|nr:tripartite tricarboxylate transporter TctB family protein [Desulforhopalus singaporensis]SDO58253.1 putative tricarboxylic transport membrane protein [Desulforhopalus singaporensis]
MAREKVGALLMLLFSMGYGMLATKIPLTFLAMQETFTSRTMPYGLSAMGAVLSLAILILPTVDPAGKKTLKEETGGMDWLKGILLVVSMLIFGLTMKWLGFILASIVFLLIGFRILGERRLWLMIVTAVPLVFFLWAIMSVLLGVFIAPGEIFYQLGIL